MKAGGLGAFARIATPHGRSPHKAFSELICPSGRRKTQSPIYALYEQSQSPVAETRLQITAAMEIRHASNHPPAI